MELVCDPNDGAAASRGETRLNLANGIDGARLEPPRRGGAAASRGETRLNLANGIDGARLEPPRRGGVCSLVCDPHDAGACAPSSATPTTRGRVLRTSARSPPAYYTPHCHGPLTARLGPTPFSPFPPFLRRAQAGRSSVRRSWRQRPRPRRPRRARCVARARAPRERESLGGVGSGLVSSRRRWQSLVAVSCGVVLSDRNESGLLETKPFPEICLVSSGDTGGLPRTGLERALCRLCPPCLLRCGRRAATLTPSGRNLHLVLGCLDSYCCLWGLALLFCF